MTLIDDIKQDLERPQVNSRSRARWTVVIDGPTLGWVEVDGPAFEVDGPTTATNLNGEDYIARHADARRIARVPNMEAALLAAVELAEALQARLDGEGGTESEHTALAAFWKAVE